MDDEDVEQTILEPDIEGGRYKENLQNLPVEVSSQLIKLLEDLSQLSSNAKYGYIDIFKNYPPIAYMNMKVLSFVLIYNSLYGDDLSHTNEFLEDKYDELLKDVKGISNISKKSQSEEFRRNLKINFASYFNIFKKISYI